MSKIFLDDIESKVCDIALLWTCNPVFKIIRIHLSRPEGFERRRCPESEKALGLLLSELSGGDASELEGLLALDSLKPFQRKVLTTLRRSVPRGSVICYGDLAALCGHPGAARAVGHAMGANPFPLFYPCHRVVGKNGLGGFGYGLEMKRNLLQLEKKGV